MPDNPLAVLESFAATSVPRGGFSHDHLTVVPGCFRCDLGRDEADDA